MPDPLKAHLMVQELDAIPTPTAVAARILELGTNRETANEEFAEIISVDPGLALQLLRNASAPERKDVSTLEIPAAVKATDADLLRRLAFTTVTPETAGAGEHEREQASGMTALRRHAVAAAAAARELASLRDYFRPEEAFAAGLISPVGELALATLRPEEMMEVRERAVGCDSTRLAELEREHCGVDHDAMAVAMGQAWDLAIELRQVLAFQGGKAEDIERDCPRQDHELVTLVRTARFLATCAGHPAYEGVQVGDLDVDVVDMLDSVDEAAVIASVQAFSETAATRATLRDGRPEQRLRELHAANNHLAHLLARSEHERRAADSVTEVLRLGLQRLGEGDPLSGLMYLTMSSMGFQRIAFLAPPDFEADEVVLTVRASSAARGHNSVAEGSKAAFDGTGFLAPVLARRGDGVSEHEPVLELLGVSACVIAPLTDREGVCHGYMTADHGPGGHAPAPGDERCLGIIADQAQLMLEYERMTREMRRLATADPLTGAATRRRMMDRLDTLIALAGRTRQPLSLAIMDLDHFKQFNDTMGHQVGDRLLQDLVKVLDRETRKTDLVARYGGEEFVVVFPGANVESAARLAEHLRQAVFDFGVEHAEDYNDTPISISIGVAELRMAEDAVAEDAMALIGRADKALYDAKHNGRNRVERAA